MRGNSNSTRKGCSGNPGVKAEPLTNPPGRKDWLSGVLTTPHGVIETPTFVPVCTKATVKAVLPE